MARAKSIAGVWDDTDVLKEVPFNGNSVVTWLGTARASGGGKGRCCSSLLSRQVWLQAASQAEDSARHLVQSLC